MPRVNNVNITHSQCIDFRTLSWAAVTDRQWTYLFRTRRMYCCYMPAEQDDRDGCTGRLWWRNSTSLVASNSVLFMWHVTCDASVYYIIPPENKVARLEFLCFPMIYTFIQKPTYENIFVICWNCRAVKWMKWSLSKCTAEQLKLCLRGAVG